MPATYAPERGDLVWLQFTLQDVSEPAGKRPALIMSPKAYNQKVGMTLVCPVISRIKGYPFEVRLPDGLEVGGVVLSDQIRSQDWRAWKAILIDRAPAAVILQVTSRILPLLDPDN